MLHTAGWATLAVLTAGSLSLTAQQPRDFDRTNARLTGTYELESTRGGNAQRAAETATRSLPPGQRDRVYQHLLARLEPPQRLSIDRDGRTITMASSRGPRSVFDADGRTQSERGPNGQMINTRAELFGDQLRVSTSGGSRGSDFSVTFESLNNGSVLRVTRRLDDEDLARPVTIQSYCRRTSVAARWDVYGPGPWFGRGSDRGRGRSGSGSAIVVPDGTRLLATLDTPVSMRSSRNGEPFTMTVRSPGEFQGARIDGVVARINAYRDGENGQDMRMDFRTIEFRGRSADFDAYLNTIRLPDGTILRVDDEGDVRDRDDNRGGDAVRNGAIGVGVGAIIGAIAGGGKGAAIGAVVGGVGGVGGGAILSRDHGQLDLPRGAGSSSTTPCCRRRRKRALTP